ncbi:MAG: acetate/propionate family kinase [Alphaproteobacteria bacterium]|nr:acetate/propionate family kinase [Alphaproteobacteria bacterium]
MTDGSYILVLNGGSSSLKFALFKDNEHTCVGRGIIAEIGKKARFSAKGELFEGKTPPDVTTSCATPGAATEVLLAWLESCLPPNALIACGHRVVHGRDLKEHSIVRPHLLAYLKSLIPLAPLHQPFNVEVIEKATALYPKVPQIACFDTAFHTTIPSLHRRYAIPRIWDEKGVRRYGFHGLSYEYVSGRLKDVAPRVYNGRAVVAHMGNGASLCALDRGKSFDTSMGFSVLEGLVMGTRPGNLDVGVLLYFMREAKLDEKAIERMLYHDSGLRGVSGITSDMAELLASQEPAAREAVDLFCLRATREIGAFASMLGGIDAIVFTGGIGENAAPIRSQIASSFGWLGVTLDESKNAAPGGKEVLLSTPQSKVEVWLIPTNEEAVIARHSRKLAEAGQ